MENERNENVKVRKSKVNVLLLILCIFLLLVVALQSVVIAYLAGGIRFDSDRYEKTNEAVIEKYIDAVENNDKDAIMALMDEEACKAFLTIDYYDEEKKAEYDSFREMQVMEYDDYFKGYAGEKVKNWTVDETESMKDEEDAEAMIELTGKILGLGNLEDMLITSVDIEMEDGSEEYLDIITLETTDGWLLFYVECYIWDGDVVY